MKKILKTVSICAICFCLAFGLTACDKKNSSVEEQTSAAVAISYDQTYANIFDDLTEDRFDSKSLIDGLPIVEDFYKDKFLGWYIFGTDKKVENGDEIVGNLTLEAKFTNRPSGLYRDNRMILSWTELRTRYPDSFRESAIEKDEYKHWLLRGELVGELIIDESIEIIGNGAFYNLNNGFSKVYIPKSVLSIGEDAFRSTSLVEIEFESDSKLKYIGESAFSFSMIESIVVPASVESIGYHVFQSCDNLQTIKFAKNCKIDELTSAIESCSSLKYVYIPASIKYIRDFYFCPGIVAFEVDGDNAFYTSVKGVLYDKDKTTLVKYPAGKRSYDAETDILDSVTTIGYEAFGSCSFTDIWLPSSITKIEDEAFCYCENLSYVVLPHISVIGEDVFRGCTSLANIYGGGGDGCPKTASGVLYSANWENLIACPTANRTSFIVPEHVKYILSGAFVGNTMLDYIILPKSIKGFDNTLYAYYGITTYLYYLGDEDDWSMINGADVINSDEFCHLYFYSETEPTEEGNFWHYDTDGVTPVVWGAE